MDDRQPFSAITPDEVIRLTGTEPFWAGEVAGETLTYTTPDDTEGQEVRVSRFAGRGGLSLSGDMEGESLDVMITPGDCSDGMSDRSYPFTVTFKIGDEVRKGCGWSDASPYAGPINP